MAAIKKQKPTSVLSNDKLRWVLVVSAFIIAVVAYVTVENTRNNVEVVQPQSSEASTDQASLASLCEQIRAKNLRVRLDLSRSENTAETFALEDELQAVGEAWRANCQNDFGIL